MILFYANCSNKYTKKYHEECPDKIGQMMNPTSGWGKPKGIYAIDNGAYNQFNEEKFFEMLRKAKRYHPPLFIVAPDVIGCHCRTHALWMYYYPILKQYGYPIAFVAQEGCEPNLVPSGADWIFIGGRDPWKMKNVKKYIIDRPVHVGRVSSYKRLKTCEMLGVDSVDGSGWFRGGPGRANERQ